MMLRRAFSASLAAVAIGGLSLAAAEPQATPAPKNKRFRKSVEQQAPQPPASAEAGLVRFEGTHSFTDAELLVPLAESLREIKASKLSPPRADDAAFYLMVFYRKQGYADAEIAWEIRGSTLVLKIKEGPRSYLGKVRFVFPKGGRHYDDATLYSYAVGETTERPKKNAGPLKLPYVEADMETGVGRVRGFYESEGYLKAVVERPPDKHTRLVNGEKFVDVQINIAEGAKYLFGTVTFTGAPTDGDTGADPFTREKLIEALGNPTGEEPADSDPPPVPPLQEAFTIQRANAMQHNLQFYLKLHSRFDAKVDLVADDTKAVRQRNGEMRVPVTFKLNAGPFYRFDGLKVTEAAPANEPKYHARLKPSFLEHRFGSLSGRPYDPRLLDERYREVLKTGLFKRLRVNTVALRDTEEVQIQLEAEEAKAREIGFSLGFSTYDGAIAGLRLSDRNFLGNGRPLSLDLNYSLRGFGTELLYVDPWWYDSNIALRAKLFEQNRTEVGYSKEEQGVRLDFTTHFKEKVEHGVFLVAKNVSITESDIATEFLGPGSYQLIGIGLTQTLDFRNNPLNPTKGWVWTVGVDADAVAGAPAFARATTRLSYYLPVQKKYLLAIGVRGGVILPFSDVPIDERFFNGGATTVRSFRERRLGPMDPGGHPIGGEAFTVFNAEFTIPIKDAFAVALFADAGNLEAKSNDAGVTDMRFAVGIGLRYQLPVGPVRLDVGLNPNPKRNEEWGAIAFSFGVAF